MIAVWILVGLAGLFAIIGFCGIVTDLEWLCILFIPAILCSIAALIVGTSISSAERNEYNQETQKLCDAKHGVLSEKNHLCYVGNTPVEFRPGEMVRPKK